MATDYVVNKIQQASSAINEAHWNATVCDMGNLCDRLEAVSNELHGILTDYLSMMEHNEHLRLTDPRYMQDIEGKE